MRGALSRTLGQVFTPESVAAFMASLFTFDGGAAIQLVDPGAGGGVLSRAVIEALPPVRRRNLRLDVIELDIVLARHLDAEAVEWQQLFGVQTVVHNVDFFEFFSSVVSNGEKYSHAVLNPPYQRITPGKGLRDSSLHATNLYSAFVQMSLELLKPGGQLVALVPRSFCNGVQFKRLRRYIAENCALVAVHSFRSRADVFARDRVLQELVILRIDKCDDHVDASGVDNVRLSWSSADVDLHLQRSIC
jgi:adenine-specific DNA-methyltransferase